MKVGFEPAPFKPATLEASYLQLGCLGLPSKMYDSRVIIALSIRGPRLVVTRLHGMMEYGSRIRGSMLHGLAPIEGGREA
jgi:hypothetical protein